MGDIVHKQIKQVEVVCEDGSLLTIIGDGTIHINDTEIKTDKGQPNIPTRQAVVSLRVMRETMTNGG